MSIISRRPARGGWGGGVQEKHGKMIDETEGKTYNVVSHLKLLRGWVQFPTGGKARELSEKSSADPVMIPEPTVQSG